MCVITPNTTIAPTDSRCVYRNQLLKKLPNRDYQFFPLCPLFISFLYFVTFYSFLLRDKTLHFVPVFYDTVPSVINMMWIEFLSIILNGKLKMLS